MVSVLFAGISTAVDLFLHDDVNNKGGVGGQAGGWLDGQLGGVGAQSSAQQRVCHNPGCAFPLPAYENDPPPLRLVRFSNCRPPAGPARSLHPGSKARGSGGAGASAGRREDGGAQGGCVTLKGAALQLCSRLETTHFMHA